MSDALPGSDTPNTLLRRVRDPRDQEAWREFFAYCDPKLRRFARELRLDPQSADEVCREAWHRLWIKIQAFEYEPGKRFRHWLWTFFKRQAFDYLKMRGRERHRPVDFLEGQAEGILPPWVECQFGDDSGDPEDLVTERTQELLAQAFHIQESIRRRVQARTWQAYWLVAIEGKSFDEAGRSLGLSYLTTYKAVGRVRSMLASEGMRVLRAERTGD